jgi:hypothetical protein
MNRITFTLDERGFIHRICANEEVEVYIVDPRRRRDRVDHGARSRSEASMPMTRSRAGRLATWTACRPAIKQTGILPALTVLLGAAGTDIRGGSSA